MSIWEDGEGLGMALQGIRFGDVRHSQTLPMLIES